MTWARAVLHSGDDLTAEPGCDLVADGQALRWPDHAEAATIGRQWSGARALTELGHRLGDHAFGEVAANAVDRPVIDPAPPAEP